AGDVNGLPFVDASASLAADTRGVTVRDGRVRVGTTGVAFAAVSRPNDVAVDVAAPAADFEDFNNYFDTGDTLAGRGSLRFFGSFSGGRLTTDGRIDVSRLRYRSLPIGDTQADWRSVRNVANGTLSVGG